MSVYTCPLCKKIMDRDLAVYLEHTNQHVIDQIKKAHPEWVESDGACRPCAEYYRAQLSGEGRGKNIGPKEKKKRKMMGYFFLALSLAAGFHMVYHGWAHTARIVLVFPFFLAFFGIIQARECTCAALGLAGKRNMDNGPAAVEDPDIVELLRQRSREILLRSGVLALAATAVFFVLPVRS